MDSSTPESPTAANGKQAAFAALKVVFVYAAFAAIWILVSDNVVGWVFSDPAQIVFASTIKGWLFVAITSVLLYRLIRRLIDQLLTVSRRELEAQTKKSEALHLLGNIADNSSDAIFAKDLEGRYLLVNREAARAIGKTAAQVLGSDDLSLFPEEQGRMLRANDLRVIADKRVSTYEEAISTVDGERIYLATKGPLRDGAGRVFGIFGISRDITGIKRAEAERTRLGAQLRESQKMEALGTLAGGVAHDFNNVLAIISGNVELARQDLGPDHPAMQSLEEIGKASRRAKDMVQQVLAFGRRQKMERRATALSLVVLESARLLRAALPAGVGFSVDCRSDAPPVLADGTQVSQILLNLCSNALESAQDQPRPGRIEIRLEACTLGEARGVLRPGRYACLSVRDNGCGMDEATRARIFEPFFTTKPVGKGTGLGLSVVHGIVRAHEAEIEVQSIPGEGSEFRIYFPAVDAQVIAADAPVNEISPVEGKGKHILCVDDEAGLVLLMKRLLERQGFRVSGYTDPREALAAARADPDQFDLVVTDYNMPYLSGLEVAQALKEIRAELPVVVASGYITEELRVKATAAGVRELIYKPNTVDELCAAVARFASTQAVGTTPKPS